LRWFATTWVELARNTPALIQLFFFGFGLGAFGIFLSPFMIVLMGLTFNCAGYLAENFRGGFQAIPDTQLRAARSLGMTPGRPTQGSSSRRSCASCTTRSPTRWCGPC
jgi:ABC-type amino acid transport system permease subunit